MALLLSQQQLLSVGYEAVLPSLLRTHRFKGPDYIMRLVGVFIYHSRVSRVLLWCLSSVTSRVCVAVFMSSTNRAETRRGSSKYTDAASPTWFLNLITLSGFYRGVESITVKCNTNSYHLMGTFLSSAGLSQPRSHSFMELIYYHQIRGASGFLLPPLK